MLQGPAAVNKRLSNRGVLAGQSLYVTGPDKLEVVLYYKSLTLECRMGSGIPHQKESRLLLLLLYLNSPYSCSGGRAVGWQGSTLVRAE